MGELRTMGGRGDTKLIWDADNDDEVENAERTFNDLTGKGYSAFKVKGKSGEKGERITKFDSEAERIILVPRMAGG